MQLGHFLTAVQHDLPIKIVVIKNNTLGLIKWEQMVFLGNPEYGVNMAPLDFVKFAEAAGARGMHIADPASCAEQMREAFSWDGPVIIECLVDAHEPPIPAKEEPGHDDGPGAAAGHAEPQPHRPADGQGHARRVKLRG
jgi:pyruvate dehydrogenase (quinone)